jgi:hypothetical protein
MSPVNLAARVTAESLAGRQDHCWRGRLELAGRRDGRRVAGSEILLVSVARFVTVTVPQMGGTTAVCRCGTPFAAALIVVEESPAEAEATPIISTAAAMAQSTTVTLEATMTKEATVTKTKAVEQAEEHAPGLGGLTVVILGIVSIRNGRSVVLAASRVIVGWSLSGYRVMEMPTIGPNRGAQSQPKDGGNCRRE